jgi:carbonic anhydrase/acetyltransferase-like protein (isoleucine patch superfamily)
VIIGDNVIIGHGSAIDSGKIGNNVLIGINSTILFDAEIGNFCIIAASCLVTRGMKIPDRSFVIGIPGKIQSETSAKQLWWVQEGPETYAKLAKQYKEQRL